MVPHHYVPESRLANMLRNMLRSGQRVEMDEMNGRGGGDEWTSGLVLGLMSLSHV
jgi:hypothetical protein